MNTIIILIIAIIVLTIYIIAQKRINKANKELNILLQEGNKQQEYWSKAKPLYDRWLLLSTIMAAKGYRDCNAEYEEKLLIDKKLDNLRSLYK